VLHSESLVSVFHPLTYESWSNFTLLLQRITAAVAEGLSALGLLLAVMGLAGAISYSVSERKKELGIRVALGAGEGRLMSMILRQTLVVSGAGVGIGIALGTVATALLRSKFFGIGVVEWTVLLPTGAGMLLASLAVAYLSARPWIAVNPMEAVRHA
jgi:ABC-type antimicrobial peptide transport system permease subunit